MQTRRFKPPPAQHGVLPRPLRRFECLDATTRARELFIIEDTLVAPPFLHTCDDPVAAAATARVVRAAAGPFEAAT